MNMDDSMSESADTVFVVARNRFRKLRMPPTFEMELCDGHNLYEITADELQHLLSSSNLSSVTYTNYCLERIRRINPYLECVIETNPDAVDIAEQMDEERRRGKVRGPLHGMPVLVKDNMATADKMETTAGSWALLGCKVPKDAFIIDRLRKAGAVILGKSNLDEWAGMRGSKYSCGFSARGGQCRNVYDLRRSPNGSSSGSAVAVSANIVPLAFGTETDCSVISPGMVNGVVAVKPTVGLTSRGGVIPISETQDSVGPYGKCVVDVARALDVIAGIDEDDKYTSVPGRRQPLSYCDHLTDGKSLQGAKFGLPMKRFWSSAPEPQKGVAQQVFKLIERAGAEIVPVDMPCAEERIGPDGEWDWERYGETQPEISEITVSKVQTYYLMKEYLSNLTNTPMKSLEDIVRFNDENTGSEGGIAGDLPAFPDGQILFRKCVETKGVKDETYYRALKHIQSQCRENGIDAALKYKTKDTSQQAEDYTQELDALLFCDVKQGGIQIAAQAGYPIISIPIGLDPEGMPVALTLQHTAWQEDKLIKWASAIEDLLENHRDEGFGRVPPTFKNHLCKNVPVEKEYRY